MWRRPAVCWAGKERWTEMPVGVIVCSLALALGGILGAVFGKRLSDSFKENMDMIMGACSLMMGAASVCLMETVPAVTFAIIVGTALGLILHLGDWVARGASAMQRGIARLARQPAAPGGEGNTAALVTVLVLFCASGTGVYGSIVSGLTGDHSILLAKAIMDCFTALVFACSLGPVVAVVALPQALVFCILYACGGLILPHTNPTMINDFKACGGVIMLCTGLRMLKLRQFPIADMLPAMALVMPVSWLWTGYVAPLLARLAG